MHPSSINDRVILAKQLAVSKASSQHGGNYRKAFPLQIWLLMAAAALLSASGAVWAILANSCHVAQSVSEPSGHGLLEGIKWLQWRSLQHRAAAPEARSANKQLLLDLRKIFEEYRITYWLADGTLLGLARNGRMIPHDGDGDVAILLEGWQDLQRIDASLEKGIAAQLQLKNVRLEILNSTHHDSSERDLAIPMRISCLSTGRHVDVGLLAASTVNSADNLPLYMYDAKFFYPETVPTNQRFINSVAESTNYQNCNGCLLSTIPSRWLRGMALVRVPEDWILPTRTCTFEGERFSCPRKTDTYLAYYYGPSFKTAGDPAAVCAKVADLSSLLMSWSSGHLGFGWKREDGSRWDTTSLGNSPEDWPKPGSIADAGANAASMHRQNGQNLESSVSSEGVEVTTQGRMHRLSGLMRSGSSQQLKSRDEPN